MLGNGGKAVLDYFAPSIAVVFLFIGSGLGMRSLLMERATGTLARLAAAPIRPRAIVWGKLLAIASDRARLDPHRLGGDGRRLRRRLGRAAGRPLDVPRRHRRHVRPRDVPHLVRPHRHRRRSRPRSIVGLLLALLGGNLLPPGALPEFLQVLSLGTPNGWALVGFGRLALLHDPASSVLGPFAVLCLIALVTGGLAMLRVRQMVTAVIAILRVNLRRAGGDRRSSSWPPSSPSSSSS